MFVLSSESSNYYCINYIVYNARPSSCFEIYILKIFLDYELFSNEKKTTNQEMPTKIQNAARII